MRSDAKASSAGPTQRQAPSGLGGGIRGAFAIRGDADGSNAPSRRGRLSLLALASTALALLAFAPLSQAKVPINGFGLSEPVTSPLGGQFAAFSGDSIRGIAVNNSGVGAPKGTTYVVDPRNRIQRFGPTGAFERAWGEDVIATSYDERQRVIVNATGGTYTLSFNGATTEPIAYDTESLGVIFALVDLSTIGPDIEFIGNGPCSGSGVSCTYRFIGKHKATNVPQMTVDTSQLQGTAKVLTMIEGVGGAATGGSSKGFEVCTVAGHCKEGAASSTTANGGQLSEPQGVAVNQANGHVYVTESENRRVSEFDANGGFIRAWGWDVITAGQPNDTGTGFEICEVAAECKQGASGENGGQFGFDIGYPVTDASNDVWVPDASNRRIQKFDSSGNFIAAYGYDVDALGGGGALESCTSVVAGACQAATSGSGAGQFAGASPRHIAFDSGGNVYAIDAGNNRVQKFDPALATAVNFGAATFATLTTQAPENLVATVGGSRLAFTINRNVGGNERQVVELDVSDASLKDTSLAGSGLTSLRGLAADATSGNIYATAVLGFTNTPEVLNNYGIFVLGATPPAIALSIDPVSSPTDTAASLVGAVDPLGAWVDGCEFQYSTDQTTWKDLALPECKGLSLGGGPQPVGAEATGLDPNTQYFVRLQASRPLTPGSTATTITRAFKTDAPPPVIEDVGAVQISDTSARMVATIDPRNTDTGYVFQYGLTPALGSSTAPVNIGSGTTPLTVSQPLGGLSPDTTYYFRVVATNLTGTTEGTTKTLHTRATPLPNPEHRAWEQVSPVDKNFGDANAGYGMTRASVSLDGNAVGFCSSNLFGEPPGKMSFLCAPYISRRTATGWETPNNLPEYCKTDPVSGNEDGGLGIIPSADYSRVVLIKAESAGCTVPPLDPAAPLVPGAMSFNLYLQNPLADPPTYDLLNPQTGGADWTLQSFTGGSDDYSHVVIRSMVNQTPEPDSPPPAKFKKIYDFSQQGVGGCVQPGGCLTLVSKDTSNVPFETPSAIPAIHTFFGTSWELASAVSDDGERIFFANADSVSSFAGENSAAAACNGATCEIYLREGGTVTHEVSASECTTACGAPQSKGDYFLSATPSGEQAFFTSCARLSDDASPEGCFGPSPFNNGESAASKLYRWDLNGAPGHKLVDLTADHEPADGIQPNFRGLIGHSEDGEVAYFVTVGQIVAGGPVNDGAESRIYRWRWNGGSPSVDYLGPYQTLKSNWGAEMNLMQQHRQVSSDGEHLMVFTELAMDPAGDRDADTDVYRWNEAEGWLCASCQAPGAPSGGDVDLTDVWFEYFVGFFPEAGNLEQRIYMSEDGQRIVFGTPDALVPEDVNGEASCELEPFTSVQTTKANVYACEDVYEWHDGTLSLVSSGIGTSAARLIATTPTGRDVFFYTRERLVGWDRDDGVDIYDARLGGGFPEPPPQPPTCEGEGCRGQVTVAPSGAGAGTAQFEGAPDPTPKRSCPKGQVKRRGACVKKKRAKRAAKRAHKRAAANKRRAQR